MPLAMFNYLLFPLMLGIIGYYFTAIYEERILVEKFGEEYIKYQKRVGMLIPLIGKKRNNINKKNHFHYSNHRKLQ